MSVLMRVEDEPPRSRLTYFRHVVADTFVPFDLRVKADDDLRAQILTGHVGTVQVTWSASAIAARWGLTDPAHFSRAFRAAYGLPPSEYRREATRSVVLQ